MNLPIIQPSVENVNPKTKWKDSLRNIELVNRIYNASAIDLHEIGCRLLIVNVHYINGINHKSSSSYGIGYDQ